MTRQTASVALGILFAADGALAADMPPGKAVFDRNCAVCHAPGPGHPGGARGAGGARPRLHPPRRAARIGRDAALASDRARRRGADAACTVPCARTCRTLRTACIADCR